MVRLAQNKVFFGTFIHCKKGCRGELEYLFNTAVCVDALGTIVAVKSGLDEDGIKRNLLPTLGWSEDQITITRCGQDQFFFPGFIDTHLHAPQYPNNGIFGQTTLLDWLTKYTFPAEAALGADPERARRVYSACVRKTIAHGTTTASYFATIDVAATNLLTDLCISLGQRAFVGRVNMDCANSCPDFYRDESADAALAKTRETIAHIDRRRGALPEPPIPTISPILTPRFAPSCTPDLLRGLARIHAETNLPIQTHISENLGEIALVAELFAANQYPATHPAPPAPVPASAYAGVYDSFGLLTPRTVLAHAIHLTDAEAQLVAARGAKVAHCPCSNSALASGAARVRWLWAHGIAVGLGTDMSGGYSPSVLETARQASLVSRHVAMAARPQADQDPQLTVAEVLFLATRGGAEVLGLEGAVGGFEVGMQWDAQLVGLARVPAAGEEGGAEDGGNVDIFGWENWEERVAKWVFGGDDRNTKAVWVQGKLVHERVGC